MPDRPDKKKQQHTPKPAPVDAYREGLEDLSEEAILEYGAVDREVDTDYAPEETTVDWETFGGDNYTAETLQGTATEAFTGGLTAGAVSEDMTQAYLGGGSSMGGPSGGDIMGAGAGGSREFKSAPETAPGKDRPIDDDIHEDTGMAQKSAAENTETLLREEITHGKGDTQNRR